MARPVSLVLFLVSLALAACGDDNGGLEPPPPMQPPGVELDLDRETAMPGDTLQLTVVNRTRGRLEYGVAYRLERLVDGRWRWINRESAFVLILKFVEPGRREREKIRLPRDLKDGLYRIVKSFTEPGGRELRASIDFRVF